MQRWKIEKISIFNSLDVIFDFLMSWVKNSNRYQLEVDIRSSQNVEIKYLS